jgi:hypothetical protein
VQLLGGTGKTQVPRHRFEDGQLAKSEINMPKPYDLLRMDNQSLSYPFRESTANNRTWHHQGHYRFRAKDCRPVLVIRNVRRTSPSTSQSGYRTWKFPG